jgi:aspartate-semialdehyde dehydrogenase
MEDRHVALVGAPGLLGEEVLTLLEERAFPVSQLTLLASADTAGERLAFRGRSQTVQLLTHDLLAGVDIAFFTADADVSKTYAPQAVSAGAIVIDSSNAFRSDPHVPVCVPEVNAPVLRHHQGIIAMPHSMTTPVSLALAPLHAAATLTRVAVCTYQSLSEMGRLGVQELDQQLRDLLNFRPVQTHALPHQIAFNCLPHCGHFLENGYTDEEMAFITETRALLGLPALPVTATAAYIPVAHGHSTAVSIETSRHVSVAEARDILAHAAGLALLDDTRNSQYPHLVQATGKDEVFVGRIRADVSVANGLHFWIAADNLRKGSALNAVHIAEHLVAAGTPRR